MNPRRARSLASSAALAAVVPLTVVAVLEHVGQTEATSSAHFFWHLAVIALCAVAVHATVSLAIWRWTREVSRREADDHSPLPPTTITELRPLAAWIDSIIARQRAEMEAHKRTLADASHQLRTPLAVLRTQLQGALDGNGDIAFHVPQLLQTVDRAAAVTSEILASLKIEQRQREPVPWESLALEDVAKEAAIEFAPLIAEKRLEFVLEAAPIRVKADCWMLGELVRNLLANAIQHSAVGAALGIVVRSVDKRAELIVWDCGHGISQSQRERLFEPFAAARGGTGLGLSICRQFARALGADVQLFDRIDDGRIAGVDALVRWN
jgi:two-component system sensor histidine kinase TctE